MAVIENQRILAVIPARGGSKGVPGKNVRLAGGKPLIAWTIEAARQSVLLDRVILSSDDSAIIAAAKKYDCEVPFVREPELATDTASTIDVVLDAVERCPGFDWVVVLQPTSPLRTSTDIDQTIRNCIDAQAPACVSVCEAQESPYWMYVNQSGERLKPLLPDCSATRRQDLPRVYSLNGAVYVANIEWLKRERKFLSAKTVSYEMPFGRSLDIDTEADFVQLQTLLGDS